MLLAATSRKQAIGSIKRYACRAHAVLEKGEVGVLMDALVNRHQAIAQLHFQDMSLSLQHAKPMVSEEVIR